jgi:hypothetical protein
MDGVEPGKEGAVRYALDLLNAVNGVQSLGLTPLSLSDFSLYDFELVTYLQSQLRLTRPKK